MTFCSKNINKSYLGLQVVVQFVVDAVVVVVVGHLVEVVVGHLVEVVVGLVVLFALLLVVVVGHQQVVEGLPVGAGQQAGQEGLLLPLPYALPPRVRPVLHLNKH